MERSNTALLNGRKATAGDEESISDSIAHAPTLAKANILTDDERQTLPAKEPDAYKDKEKEVETPTPESGRKKRPIAIIAAGLGIGAIVAGSVGYRWWQYASTHQETDNATVTGHVHQVSTRINGTVDDILVKINQPVQKGQLLVKLDPSDYQIKVQQAQAALEAAKRQAKAAQANIALAAETASATTTQAQGDVSGAQAAIATAQAAVSEAESGIPAAQAAVAEAQAGIPAAQAQLAQANATLQRTQADYNRYNTLFSQGAISSQQLESARAAYQVALAQRNGAQQGIQQAQARLAAAKVGVTRAQANLAQAQEGVASAQAKLASSRGGLQQASAKGQQTEVNRSQYEAAEAAIAQSEASLKDAQQQLSYTNITSPADGWVGKKNVEVGNRVQPGQPLIAVVGNEFWVTANFKETQLENMKPGQLAEIKLDAFPHHPFKAHVESISPASGAQFALLPPDNATGNFTKVVQRIPVKLIFDSQSIQGYESRINPGMSAEVSVEVK
jgi:membrane fusion protein (multidrug efflux system)